MKAIWNGVVLAETERDELIYIEGNWYFPPNKVNKEYLSDSQTHTTCFWKGEASYFNVNVDGQVNPDSAWYYPKPTPGSIEKVKKDFSNYIAFWKGIQVTA